MSPRALEKVIEQDPALTAKVLRVATSSYYGSKPTTSVGRALSVMGMNALRSVAISLAYQQILSGKGNATGLDSLIFGRHCLAVAVAAKSIARYLAPQMMEELYVAGLLHDVGLLTLERFCPFQLNQAIKQAQLNGISLFKAEHNILKYDHAEVGGLLADKWKLSPLMKNVIRYHFQPELEAQPTLATAIVIGANYLAYQCGFPAIPNVEGHVEGALHFNELGMSQEQINDLEATIVAEVELADKTYGDDMNQKQSLNDALVKRQDPPRLVAGL